MTTTKTNKNGRVFSYLRWSSGEQTLGDSERRQEQLAKNWCYRNGRTLCDRTFADRGLSGWKGLHRQSGALGVLLNVVEPNDVILIEDCDRWSREAPLDSLNALRDVVNRGVEIVFLKTGITVNKSNFNDASTLIPTFFGSFLANAENERRSFRIREAMKSRRAQIEAGKAVQGRLPAWLEWDRKQDKPVVDEVKAKVVAKVFELCLAGHGVRSIEHFMRSVPPIANSKKANWNTRFIYRLLTDKSVLGYHSSTGKKIYPAILDKKIFYTAAAKLKARKILTVPISRQNSSLFTSLVYCSNCGMSLVRQTTYAHGKKYHYLVCSGNLRGRSNCNFHALRYDHFEQSFLALIMQTDLIAEVLYGDKKENSRLDVMNGELNDVRNQCEKCMKLIGDDPNPPKRIVEHLKTLEARETNLQKQIEDEETNARDQMPTDEAYAKFLEQFGDRIDQPECRSRIREAFREIIDRIVVVTDKKEYAVHFRQGKMPVTVILGKSGWLISPAPSVVSHLCLQ